MKENRDIICFGVLLVAIGLTAFSMNKSAGVQSVSFPESIKLESSDEANKISVSASEKVIVTPDISEVGFVIESHHTTSEECTEDNDKVLNKALDSLHELGIGDADIRVSNYDLSPEYDYDETSVYSRYDSKKSISGYVMTTSVTVNNIEIAKTGDVLGRIIDSGATEINTVNYRSSKYDESYNEALSKAVTLAQSKAEAIAKAGGATGVELAGVNEGGSSYNYISDRADTYAVERAGATKANLVTMPVSDMEIAADVHCSFNIIK